MKYKNILIPIDFSDDSNPGLTTGISLSNKIKAKLHLLHIIDDSSPSQLQVHGDMIANKAKQTEHDVFIRELIKKRSQDLQELMSKYNLEGVEVKSTIDLGKFQDTLEEYVNDQAIDFIVMGTSGETAFTEFFKGNHAARAMRISEVPVLVVKAHSSFSDIAKSLLLLVDLKDYQKDAVKLIRDFAQVLDMKVFIAHVKQKADAVVDNSYKKLEKFAKKNKFDNYSLHLIGHGEKVEQITDFTSAWDIDIIASITAGDEGILRLLFGSDTEKFIEEIDQPMLLVSET